MTSDGEQRGYTRKSFLVALGSGAAATICGLFLFHEGRSETTGQAAQTLPSKYPRLKQDLGTGREGELLTLTTRDDPHPVVCAVNQPGMTAMGLMNGRRTIEEIAKAMADEYRLDRTESLTAKVAGFTAQLGMMGFLEEPYYACISYEETTT